MVLVLPAYTLTLYRLATMVMDRLPNVQSTHQRAPAEQVFRYARQWQRPWTSKEVSLTKAGAQAPQRLHFGHRFDFFRHEPRTDLRGETDQGCGEGTMRSIQPPLRRAG